MSSKQLRRDLTLLLAGASLVALGYGIARVHAEGIPAMQPLMYAGTIDEGGVAPNGERVVTAQFWDAYEGGSQLCPEVIRTVPVSEGRFRLEISPDCTNALRSHPDAWVQVGFQDVSGVTRTVKRAKVGAVPFAFEADHALTANSASQAAEATHAASADHASGDLNATLDSGKQVLPWSQTKVVRISNTALDLGDQLLPLMAAYRSVRVNLAANSTFKWNTQVRVESFQQLLIVGENYDNGATNITVDVLMDEAKQRMRDASPNRAPSRLVTNGGRFEMNGVRVTMSVVDNAPMGPWTDQGALFVNENADGEIALAQLRISSTENIVNLGSWGYGRVKFGHTFIDKHPSSPRDILAVTAFWGWGFAGAGGVVSHSHTTLGTGVTFEQSPRITYLDR